jgi:hypothetical protein
VTGPALPAPAQNPAVAAPRPQGPIPGNIPQGGPAYGQFPPNYGQVPPGYGQVPPGYGQRPAYPNFQGGYPQYPQYPQYGGYPQYPQYPPQFMGGGAAPGYWGNNGFGGGR